MMRAAFVLWDGLLFGGAEVATIGLCGALRERGVEATVVFVGSAGVYEDELRRSDVPWATAGYPKGSAALRRPGALVAAVREARSDVVVVPGANFLATALRIGGWTGPLVAVEHGGLLQAHSRSSFRRAADHVDRLTATPWITAQVAVSDFLRSVLETGPHAGNVVRIHNGVDTARYRAAASERGRRHAFDDAVVVGCAGKLMPGKGFEDIIDACALVRADCTWYVEIAGDGPLRAQLQAQALEAGVADRVRFCGWVSDIPRFWGGCDIAVAASNGCVESFGMVVAEALASGIPVIVSRSGGLPEVLGASGAGEVYEPGDIGALARAMERFITDADTRDSAAVAALQRAESFSIESAARDYAQLLERVAGGGHGR